MGSIKFDNFQRGLMTAPVETEIPLGASVVAENIDYSFFGKLIKQKGTKSEVSLPANTTFKNGIYYRWNLPSPFGSQDTWIIHVTDDNDSDRDELWWRPYWNPITEAWVDDWQELTEFEGPLTADGSTVGDSITDAGLSQSTDDYYNGWVVLNIDRQATAEVYNFIGSGPTLELRDTISGQTSGDTYYVYRFPLMMYLEGSYTTDSGTDTTSLVDTSLRSTVEDSYVGWKLVNTTRSSEVTISGYDAASKTLSHPTIASQTSGDSYYIYKDTHDIDVEDIVRFFPLDNAIEMSVGNDKEFPQKAPLWFGFIDEKYFFDYDKSSSIANTKFVGFWLCRNVLDKPDVTALALSDVGVGTLADDTYYFRTTFVYDGFQEGPHSLVESIDPSSSNQIYIDLDLPLWSNNSTYRPSYWEAILNKRITGIRIYGAKGNTDANNEQFYLLADVPLSNVKPIKFTILHSTFTIVIWTRTSDRYESPQFRLSDGIWTGGDQANYSGVVFAKQERWDILQGHTSKRLDANYNYLAILNEIYYRAATYVDERRNAFIFYSVFSGDGVPMKDVVPIENFIGLSNRGIDQITGVVDISGFLVVLSPNAIFRYSPGQELIEVPLGKGAVSPDAIVKVGNLIYFAGYDDVYEFNGINEPRKLMFGKILDKWQEYTATQKENSVAGHHKKTDTIWLLVGGDIFLYDRQFNAWRQYKTTVGTIIRFIDGLDGEIYAATATDVYKLEASDFTDTVNLKWKSSVVDFVKEINGIRKPVRGNVKRILLKHKGDDKIQISGYDPAQSTTYPVFQKVFFPQSLSKEELRDLSVRMSGIQILVESVDQGGSQPEHEIDYVDIEFDEVTP